MNRIHDEILQASDAFVSRHLGSSDTEIQEMLASIGFSSLDELAKAAVPKSIQIDRPLRLPPARSESEALADIRTIAEKNHIYRSLLGMGYSDCIVPPVIQRNILENPGWYTQYTPYQAEISQGRLEALLNFQTMIAEMTGLPMSNASLLDEATAAAEAMTMCFAIHQHKKTRFVASDACHPQTLAVLQTRAEPLGIRLEIASLQRPDLFDASTFGLLVQYPTTEGCVEDYRSLADAAHKAGVSVIAAADLLALALLTPPGEWGADIAVGSAQRFGVPLGFGGPHAAYLSTKNEYRRQMPGRIIGVSKDAKGKKAFRLSLQTREQHIRRDKATSNICTAQVLLAIMASMYAVYHGPKGLKRIASRVHGLTAALAVGLQDLGYPAPSAPFFDTLTVPTGSQTDAIAKAALAAKINLRRYPDQRLGIALDERSSPREVEALLTLFAQGRPLPASVPALLANADLSFPEALTRKTPAVSHEIFDRYHSEHEMLRYLHRLQAKDLSLTTSMISLGSCTMKLNATAEMFPISWPHFASIHPFAPADQTLGYQQLFADLETWLAEITGFAAISLQPNAGSQGEYAGLLVIRAYHRDRGDTQRDVCLIPVSAHGTNPASAVMAGFRVVPVACNERGDIDMADLQAKAQEHQDRLGALMATYPSTHGVFEEDIKKACALIHTYGGQVYMDGANMNAQVGLCRPGDIGADVCHLNLHKTFCIPHGGGGPGIGPIGVASHLAPYLPGHPVAAVGGSTSIGPVSAASHGSASILPISWMYIAMMGPHGLKKASQVAILNANYMAKKLAAIYPILYRGNEGLVAHEFILDLRPLKPTTGIEAVDVAKRLMDFGFHAPTMSFPVPGTLMIEPTESESKAELDRFCETMRLIREEFRAIEEGKIDRADNPLKHAPHTSEAVVASEWTHSYPREQAAFPAPWTRKHKYWPTVSRIDDAYGDRNLVCTCPPMSEYEG